MNVSLINICWLMLWHLLRLGPSAWNSKIKLGKWSRIRLAEKKPIEAKEYMHFLTIMRFQMTLIVSPLCEDDLSFPSPTTNQTNSFIAWTHNQMIGELFLCSTNCINILWIYACAGLCLVIQLCPTLCSPMDCNLTGSSVHGDSPGKNTGVSCHALL